MSALPSPIRRIAITVSVVLAIVAAWQLLGASASTADTQADPCPNAQIRSQQNAGHLPDCRAYEQVSPVDKGGNHAGLLMFDYDDITAAWSPVSSSDGKQILFGSMGVFAGSQSTNAPNAYVAERSGAWDSRSLNPPLGASGSQLEKSEVIGTTPDFSKQLVETAAALTPGSIDGGWNIYIRDSRTNPPSYELVGSAPTWPDTFTGDSRFGGASSDGKRWIFVTRAILDSTPAVPASVGLDPFGQPLRGKIYEYETGENGEGGELRYVAFDEADNPVALNPGGTAPASTQLALHPVSVDASSVYYSPLVVSTPTAGTIYNRHDGEVAVVTKRESDSAQRLGVFAGATPDGAHAFFRTPQRLTDDASPGVNEKQLVTVGDGAAGGTFTLGSGQTQQFPPFVTPLDPIMTALGPTEPIAWDATAAEVESALEDRAVPGFAPDVSVTGPAGGPWTVEFVGPQAGLGIFPLTGNGSGLTPAGTVTVSTLADGYSTSDLYRYDRDADDLVDLTPADVSADVESVLGVASDGAYVYFQATGELAEGAVDGAKNIYVWHAGEIELVATSAGGVTAYRGRNFEDPSYLDASLADARVSPNGRFLSFIADGPISGPTSFPGRGAPQAYLYDFDNGTLSCVSCPSGSSQATGRVGFQMTSMAGGSYTDGLTRNLVDDGRLFFMSPDPLLAEDGNGKYDVYQYDHGDLDLITTGRSATDSFFLDAGEDGDTVFFGTGQPLVNQDKDTLADVYAARVGGGVASQNQVPRPPCEGDGCQGEASDPPPEGDPGSTDYAGPGNRGTGGGAKSCAVERKRASRKAMEAKRAKRKARKASGSKAKRLGRKARSAEKRAGKARRNLRSCRSSR